MADNNWIGVGDGKTCEEVCKYAPVGNKWPCVDCDLRYHDRAEPPEEVSGEVTCIEKDSKSAQFQRCDCGKLIVRRGDAHNCPYCGRAVKWDG